MAFTQSQSNNSRYSSLNFNKLFNNPYQYKPAELSKETRERFYEAYGNSRRPQMNAPVNEKRSFLDRAFDGLMTFNYAIAGAVDNLVDGDKSTKGWQGAWEGLKAGNPFGKGNEKGEVTFSKVLDTVGWQPESGLGKFARGTVGFAMDVAFDPTTYIGGLGLIVKGTGKVGQAGKAITNLAKDYQLPAELLSKGKVDRMTPELADAILKQSSKADKYATMSRADYAGTVNEFAKTYNRALGIREAGEVTLSLRNVPFGDKIVDKAFGVDKLGGIRLAKSNKALMQIGKYSGMGHAYGYTRNFLTGRKIVQKLSSTARYAQLAKVDPIQLFDAIADVRIRKGIQESIRGTTQSASRIANSGLDATDNSVANIVKTSSVLSKMEPAVQAQVIELMEDPANWKIVDGLINDADVKSYEDLRKGFAQDLDEMVSYRKELEDSWMELSEAGTKELKNAKQYVKREFELFTGAKNQIKELEYEADFIRASREDDIKKINEQFLANKMTKEELEGAIGDVNAKFEDELSRVELDLTNARSDYEKTIYDLSYERILDGAFDDYDIIPASREFIEQEMGILAKQFDDKINQVEAKLISSEIDEATAQGLRDELSAELKQEAERVYSRKYYQMKKAKSTEAEIAKQQEALDDVIEALEKAKSGGEAEREIVQDQINALKNKKNSLIEEMRLLRPDIESKKKVEELSMLQRDLTRMTDKAFAVDTRFSGMSEQEVRQAFTEKWNAVLKESENNLKVRDLAGKTEQGDLRKEIADNVSYVEINAMRGMISELVLGKDANFRTSKELTLAIGELMGIDKDNVTKLTSFFEENMDLFKHVYKDDMTPERLANMVQSTNQTSFLREFASMDYANISGIQGSFYSRLANYYGYSNFQTDVVSKLSEKQAVITEFQRRFDASQAKVNTMNNGANSVQDILKAVSEEGFDYTALATALKIDKPAHKYADRSEDIKTLYQAIDEGSLDMIAGRNTDYSRILPSVVKQYKVDNATAQEIIEDTILHARSGDNANINQIKGWHVDANADVLRDLAKENEAYMREVDAFKSVDVRSYNLDTDPEGFKNALGTAMVQVSREYTDAIKDVDKLTALQYNRNAEMAYFNSLNPAEKKIYLDQKAIEYKNTELTYNNFEQEFERARQARSEELSANAERVNPRDSEANLGTERTFTHDQILEGLNEVGTQELISGIYIKEIFNELPSQFKAQLNQYKDQIAKKQTGYDEVYDSAPKSIYVGSGVDNTIAFTREAFRGNVRTFNKEGMEKHINGWLAEAGKGMDKRTKPYRALKLQADEMRNAMTKREAIFNQFQEHGIGAVARMDEASAEIFFKSFGFDGLKAIQRQNDSMFKLLSDGESTTNTANILGDSSSRLANFKETVEPGTFKMVMESLDELVSARQKIVDDIYKALSDSGRPPSSSNELRTALKELDYAKVSHIMMNFAYTKQAKSAVGSTETLFRSMSNAYKSLGSEVSELSKLRNDEYAKILQDMDYKQYLDEHPQIERLLPYTVASLFKGELPKDLTQTELYRAVFKARGMVRKDFGGKVPDSAVEIEKSLNQKMYKEFEDNGIVQSYNKFIQSLSPNTYVTFKTEEGFAFGRVASNDTFPSKYEPGITFDVEVVSKDGGRSIESISFDDVKRVNNDQLSEVFATADTTVQKSLDDVTRQLEDVKESIASKGEQSAEVQASIENLSKEINTLYKQNEDLKFQYDAKIVELERFKEELSGRIGDKQQDLDIFKENIDELELERQSLLGQSYLAKFDELDPFATSSPGTKEWDELKEFIMTNDPDIKDFVPKIGEDKILARQLDKLTEDLMLGFAKGEGFIAYKNKLDILEELETVTKQRDEFASKLDVAKAQADNVSKLEGELASGTQEYMAQITKLTSDMAYNDELRTRLMEEVTRLDEEFAKAIDQNAVNMELAKREKASQLAELKKGREYAQQQEKLTQDSLAEIEKEWNKLNDEIELIEDALSSNEAMATLVKTIFDEKTAIATVRKGEGLPTYKFAIEDKAIDDATKGWAMFLKSEMDRIGIEEVEIGKLTQEQFVKMSDSYFPRVLSEEGERFFQSNQELLEKVRPLTSDYGFGRAFNNHGISRVKELQDKSLKQVNDWFQENHGVRVFEENVAKAYIGRMTKHAELMYDDKYTKTMMDIVGYEPQVVDGVLKARKGYEHVVNFSHVRDHVRDLVSEELKQIKKEGGNITDELIGELEVKYVNKLGLTMEQMTDYKLPMIKVEGESLEQLHKAGLVRDMQKNIVEEANKARMLTIERDNSKMLTLYDKFTTWLKAMQTAVMPSFHIRNFQGNLFQNWLAVGADAFDPKMIKESFQVAKAIGDRDKLRTFKPIVGKHPSMPVRHWEEIVDEAIVRGVVNEGFFAKDFDGYASSSGILGGGKWDPTSTDTFAPIQKGFEIGTLIENQGRLAQFASLLKQGYDYDTASEMVTKYLFDYTDLTYFEKKYMKRIFPYYTWMRKNSVLQVRELIEQPGKYQQVAKFSQSMENSSDPDNQYEDKFISNYARDWTILPFTQKNKDGEDEPIMFNSNLPFKDLGSLPFDPFNIVDSVRGLIAQSTPIVKKPIEVFSNYNIHYDNDIVTGYSQNPFTPMLSHVMSELAWYNAVQGFVKQDTAGDKFYSALNTLGGLKLSSFDYEANERRVVEQAWEDYIEGGLGAFLRNGQTMIMDSMEWSLRTSLRDSVIKLAGLPPEAGDYEGALAPISAETYNSLSADEKALYKKPDRSQLGYINKRADELSKIAYEESGVLKKFGWALLKMNDVPYQKMLDTVSVSKVVDGDTIAVNSDGVETSVRMLLVDTPESVGEFKDNPMAFGKEASAFTKQMVMGKDVKLHVDGTDAYGRTLAFVEVNDEIVNEELIRQGLGKVRYLYERSMYNPDVKRFRETEQEAISNNRGVWSIPGYANPGEGDFKGGRSSK